MKEAYPITGRLFCLCGGNTINNILTHCLLCVRILNTQTTKKSKGMTKQYWCWNKERPINGKPVLHGSGTRFAGVDNNGNEVYIPSVVAANTVWEGSPEGDHVPCLYGQKYGNVDSGCCGCKHIMEKL